MEHEFWEVRWTEGRIAFHQPHGHPALAGLLSRFEPPGRALVPLAGKTVDIVQLFDAGHDVVAIEFVQQAVRDFKAEQPQLSLEWVDGPLGLELKGDRLRFLAADLFKAQRGIIGDFDLIYDRAAMVALPADSRRSYAEHLRSVLKPDGHLLIVLFSYPDGMLAGPPFSVTEADLRALFPDGRVEVLKSGELTIPRPPEAGGPFPLTEHIYAVSGVGCAQS